MLTEKDIDFIAEALNKTSFNGLQTANQLVQVVMKLGEMKKGMQANEQARTTGSDTGNGGEQEALVQE